MATVVSLTKERIEELLSGLGALSLSQEELEALVGQIYASQQTLTEMMNTFLNSTLPQLQQDLAAGSAVVDNLNDSSIPDVQAALDQAEAQLVNLQTVDIPALQLTLDNEVANSLSQPKVYIQPDEPTNPDIDDRDLILGDTWYDTDAGNLRYSWDGAEWTTFGVDIADFSLTAKKFKTSTHMIY